MERLVGAVGRDVDWPNAPSLRVLHYRKAGREFYLLVNEGEQTLEGTLSLASAGALELWDPLDGSVRPWPARVEGGRTHTRLRLERRQGLVLCVNPRKAAGAETAIAPRGRVDSVPPCAGKSGGSVSLPLAGPRRSGHFGSGCVPELVKSTGPMPGRAVAAIAGPWRAVDAQGRAVRVPCPGDWAQRRGWETFSGTLRFRTKFAVPSAALSPDPVASRQHRGASLDTRHPTHVPSLFLDLGRVGDIAEVLVNGRLAGVRAWAPYVLDVSGFCRRGANTLEVRVTNSMANAYDGLQLPSGLLGPVVLRGEG